MQPISTHTPLAGRDCITLTVRLRMVISTHTPLAGRDEVGGYLRVREYYFYSHAPRGARLSL